MSHPYPLPVPTKRANTAAKKASVLKALSDAWDAEPTMRLGQLLAVWLHSQVGGSQSITNDRTQLDTLFFMEDGDVAHGLALWTGQRVSLRGGDVE